MIEIGVLLLTLMYNLAILGGTGYAVFGLGYSGWWFLLAVLCLVSARYKKD